MVSTLSVAIGSRLQKWIKDVNKSFVQRWAYQWLVYMFQADAYSITMVMLCQYIIVCSAISPPLCNIKNYLRALIPSHYWHSSRAQCQLWLSVCLRYGIGLAPMLGKARTVALKKTVGCQAWSFPQGRMVMVHGTLGSDKRANKWKGTYRRSPKVQLRQVRFSSTCQSFQH